MDLGLFGLSLMLLIFFCFSFYEVAHEFNIYGRRGRVVILWLNLMCIIAMFILFVGSWS